MTRFERELSGELGAFWKSQAEAEIAKMQERADNGEILLDGNCAAYWEKSGHYLPEECVEILSHCLFFFDAEATNKAREAQDDEFLARYFATRHAPSLEEMAEMRAAFGEGTTVVDVITGQTYNL